MAEITKQITMFLLTCEEREFNWLPQNLFSVYELISYLTAMNDNIMVYVKKIYTNYKNNKEVYEMSNGLSYSKDSNGKWQIAD